MNKLIVGLGLAALGFTLLMFIPHEWLFSQGVESDFYTTYIPQAQEIASRFNPADTTRYAHYDYHAWAYHGAAYPTMLFLVGSLFPQNQPVRGYHFFMAARVISAASAVSVLLLIVLVFGVERGIIISLFLAMIFPFVQYGYSVGTDMIAAVLALWAGYFGLKFSFRVSQTPRFYWQPYVYKLLAGILLALAVGVRHEYLFLLPALIWAAWVHNPKTVIGLLLPVVLLLAFSAGDWNTYCTLPAKYLMTDGDFDKFPPQMFSEVNLDTVDNYYTVGNQITKKYYPNVFAVAKEAGWNMPVIFLWSLWRSILCLAAELALFLVGILFLPRKSIWKYVLAAMGLHLLAVNFFGSYSERYLLFDIIVLFVVFVSGLLQIGVSKKLVAIVLILLFAVSVRTCVFRMQKNIEYNSNYFNYQNYNGFLMETIGRNPKIMSVRSQVAFVNGWDWHPWPKELHDLNAYCQRYDIDLLLYSGFEKLTRSEWNAKLEDVKLARPEFIWITGNSYGILYAVNYANPIDSTQ